MEKEERSEIKGQCLSLNQDTQPLSAKSEVSTSAPAVSGSNSDKEDSDDEIATTGMEALKLEGEGDKEGERRRGLTAVDDASVSSGHDDSGDEDNIALSSLLR